MKKFFRVGICVLLATAPFTGCSMLTTQGRQQRAYDHYVQKMSAGRVKEQRRFSAKHSSSIPELQPSEPMITSEASGPESMTDGSGSSGDGGGQ